LVELFTLPSKTIFYEFINLFVKKTNLSLVPKLQLGKQNIIGMNQF